MAIIIKLHGLPLDATSIDVRLYFEGLTIPDGGVHIVGGDDGTVFVEFSSDEDARQAMARDGGTIKNSNIKLLLSSRTEMQSVIEAARQQKQQYHNQQQEQFNLHQQQNQQNLNQQQSYLTPGASPMGPAPLSNQQQQPVPFDNDPRMLSQNYQGMLNVINQPNSPKQQQNQQQQQLQQPQQQQPAPQRQQQQQQPSPFVDPRILSQNYQGMMSALSSAQPQPMLPQTMLSQPMLPQQNPIFNQFPPTTIATSNGTLGLNMLNSISLGGAELGCLNPVVSAAGGVGGGGGGLMLSADGGLLGSGNLTGNNNGNNASNRSHSPDSRARMSGMRGGDDKLFANKRCVLAASNIPYRATSKDIIEFLSEFNIKEDCIRRRYNQKGQPTADAKIAFPTPDAAVKALKMMNKKTLCGRPVFFKPV